MTAGLRLVLFAFGVVACGALHRRSDPNFELGQKGDLLFWSSPHRVTPCSFMLEVGAIIRDSDQQFAVYIAHIVEISRVDYAELEADTSHGVATGPVLQESLAAELSANQEGEPRMRM